MNLSLGDPAFVITSLFGTALSEGIEYAWAHGAIPVLASGNTNLLGLGIGSSDYGILPAVVVGATDRRGRVSGFSSPLGTAAWGVLAPGGGGGDDADDITSTYWQRNKLNAYATLAGTSMAAPHVAGTLALLLAQGLSPEQAVVRLLASGDRSATCGFGSPNCHGRLDVAAAVSGMGAATDRVPLGSLLPDLGLQGLLDIAKVLPLGGGPSTSADASAMPPRRAPAEPSTSPVETAPTASPPTATSGSPRVGGDLGPAPADVLDPSEALIAAGGRKGGEASGGANAPPSVALMLSALALLAGATAATVRRVAVRDAA